MPRSRSSSIESSTWARIERGSTVWVSSRMRSASVDLPWSMWAMIEKLRMRLWAAMGWPLRIWRAAGRPAPRSAAGARAGQDGLGGLGRAGEHTADADGRDRLGGLAQAVGRAVGIAL